MGNEVNDYATMWYKTIITFEMGQRSHASNIHSPFGVSFTACETYVHLQLKQTSYQKVS